jgi:hypothetical protein
MQVLQTSHSEATMQVLKRGHSEATIPFLPIKLECDANFFSVGWPGGSLALHRIAGDSRVAVAKRMVLSLVVWKRERISIAITSVRKMLGVEDARCGRCSVWKMLGVEDARCGRCLVWKVLGVEEGSGGFSCRSDIMLDRYRLWPYLQPTILRSRECNMRPWTGKSGGEGVLLVTDIEKTEVCVTLSKQHTITLHVVCF